MVASLRNDTGLLSIISYIALHLLKLQSEEELIRKLRRARHDLQLYYRKNNVGPTFHPGRIKVGIRQTVILYHFIRDT
ncbi:MAG: hypothetical protein WAM14_00840 [Candidatus Nitrosopolaris sp.]